MKLLKKEEIINRLEKISIKSPYVLLYLIIVFLPPLGVYMFILKKKKDIRNLYNDYRTFSGIGLFVIALMGIGIYFKIKDIITLYDSGMSLDMINFLPDNIYMYLLGILYASSFIIGAGKLKRQANMFLRYINFVNVEKKVSLKEISQEENASLIEAKEKINLLKKYKYVVPLEIKEYKIKYLNEEVKSKSSVVQCSKCGAFINLKKDEYSECHFCGNGMILEDNN